MAKKKVTFQDIFYQKYEEWKSMLPREIHPYLEQMRNHFLKIDLKYAPMYAKAVPVPKQASDHSYISLKSAYKIKEQMDDYVIGQHEAKKALSQISYYHMAHIKRELETEQVNEDYIKTSILLIGPTGSGKTLLVNTLSRILKVPFVKVDATSMTKTGFVGDSIQDAVRELYYMSDEDMTRAECGIILVDEVDKLAGGSREDYISNSVVTGKGVQQELLRPMENSKIDLFSQTNINSIKEMMQGGDIDNKKISTRNILFILAGAFDGIEEVILKRMKKESGQSIGFGGEDPLTMQNVSLDHLQPKDLIQYGLIPELVGRITYTVPLERLDTEKLYHVLRDVRGSISRQIEQSIFETTGKKVTFSDEALKTIAAEAESFQTGGRALTEVCHRIMNEFLFHLPTLDFEEYVIEADFVTDYLPKTFALITQPHIQQAMLKFPLVARFVDWDKGAVEYITEKLLDRSVISVQKYIGDFMSSWNPIIHKIAMEQERVVITEEILSMYDENTDESNENLYSLLNKKPDFSQFNILLQGSL
ncbi:MAG: AAA family ATPase [SAR324 cluster bacterium]|nr:AAA family ATPase [SAR324 cluster bacterium]